MLQERNQVLLAKVETTKGVDASPTASNDAILCAVVNPTVDGQSLENPVVRNSISAAPERYVNKTMTFSIQLPLKGSGTAGVAPEFGPLLQACALGETVDSTVGSEKVTYAPVSSDSAMKTNTIYLYKDGILFKGLGCMGNVSSTNEAGNLPMLTFNITGKFGGVSDATNPSSPVYDETEPIEVKSYGFKFGTWSTAVIRDFGFETGNTVAQRKNINAADGIESSGITGRNPTYSATVEAEKEATHPFWGNYLNYDTVALEFTHGTESGNIVEFTAPKAGYAAPVSSSEDGIFMYQVGGQLLEDEGNDNFSLVFK